MNSESILFHANLLISTLILLPSYYGVKSRGFRRGLLSALGAYLLFLAAPHLLLFWVLFWLAVWVANISLHAVSNNYFRLIILWCAIVALMLPMIGWKTLETLFLQFLNGLFQNIYEILVPTYLSSSVVVPLGLSYTTFRGLDLIVCRYLDVLPRQTLGSVLFYGFFPPIQLMGPISQSVELLQATGGRSVEPSLDVSENLTAGIYRIVSGLFKLYVLALPLADSGESIARYHSITIVELWFQLLLHAWYFYFNFSGFSDLAIGAAKLYGFRLDENFSFPYFQRNLQDFWAHWHMSLTRFAQRNVFVPLGGYRSERQYVATFGTMMVIALWHEVSLRLVAFGTIHAVVLMLLRWRKSTPRGAAPAGRVPAIAGILATHAFVIATIPMISMQRLNLADFYQHLFTFGWL